MFSRIYVASQSTLKRDAVQAAIEANLASKDNVDCLFAEKHAVLLASTDIGCITNCPQPVGEISARYCADNRLCETMQRHGAIGDALVVVVENYIHCDGPGFPWVDRCFVRLAYRGGSVCASSIQDIEIPEKYDPQGDPDIAAPLGYSQTIGERIHNDYSDVSAKDWFRAASSTNPSRTDVIVEVLNRCFAQIAQQRRLRQQFRQYDDFPKPGVRFDDMFSCLAVAHGCEKIVDVLVSQVDAFIGPVCIEKNDSLGAPNLTAQESWSDRYFVAGLESRGMMLAAMLAARLGTPFVPIRKAGKLPGAVLTEHFSKEYGLDTFEIQETYLQTVPKRAIIVDDVLATGGSMTAACRLVQTAGKEIALILSLVDIPCLREQCAVALAPFGAPTAVALAEFDTLKETDRKRKRIQ